MVVLIGGAAVPACGTGRSGRSAASEGDGQTVAQAAPGACRGEFQKKLQDMTADLQKMGDQEYKVEMADASRNAGITIYARMIPRAVRQYLTASHVDTVPEVRRTSHRGYYEIRPRPSATCGLDYDVHFIAP